MNKSTAAFVKRRHHRHKKYVRERWMRWARRSHRVFGTWWSFLKQWFWLSLVTAAAVGMAVALFSPLLRVREIRVRRTDARLDVEKIQKGLRPLFGRHLAFISPRDVRLLVQDAMPDASDVLVRRSYPSTLSLTITLQPLLMRLQIADATGVSTASSSSSMSSASSASSTSQSSQGDAGSASFRSGSGSAPPPPKSFDYLTEDGLYVSLPFEAQGAKALPLLKAVDWAVRPQPSLPLVRKDLLTALQQAEKTLTEQFGLKVSARTVYLRAREFHLGTPKYSLWFDMANPLEEQFGRLKIFLRSAAAAQTRQYVDLRLAGRIVFR